MCKVFFLARFKNKSDSQSWHRTSLPSSPLSACGKTTLGPTELKSAVFVAVAGTPRAGKILNFRLVHRGLSGTGWYPETIRNLSFFSGSLISGQTNASILTQYVTKPVARRMVWYLQAVAYCQSRPGTVQGSFSPLMLWRCVTFRTAFCPHEFHEYCKQHKHGLKKIKWSKMELWKWILIDFDRLWSLDHSSNIHPQYGHVNVRCLTRLI